MIPLHVLLFFPKIFADAAKISQGGEIIGQAYGQGTFEKCIPVPLKLYCLKCVLFSFSERLIVKTIEGLLLALPWISAIMSIKCLKRPGKLDQINRVTTAMLYHLEKAVSKSILCNTSQSFQM